MTIKTLLSLASIVLLTTVARAAQDENDMVVLPTYTVEAPRYTAAEMQINASLDEMRQLAKVPVAYPAGGAALRAVAREASVAALPVPASKPLRLAKS